MMFPTRYEKALQTAERITAVVNTSAEEDAVNVLEEEAVVNASEAFFCGTRFGATRFCMAGTPLFADGFCADGTPPFADISCADGSKAAVNRSRQKKYQSASAIVTDTSAVTV